MRVLRGALFGLLAYVAIAAVMVGAYYAGYLFGDTAAGVWAVIMLAMFMVIGAWLSVEGGDE